MAITGDLTNLSLPEEFSAAGQVVAALCGPKEATKRPVFVVPGNHDVYCLSGRGEFERGFPGQWAGPGRPLCVDLGGGVGLVGLGSGAPRPPFVASGAVPTGELRRAEEFLGEGSFAFRIALLHHPPNARYPTEAKEAKSGLENKAEVAEFFARSGVNLALHGHTHRAKVSRLGATLVVEAGSATDKRYGPRYNIYDIENAQLKGATARRFDYPSKSFKGEEIEL